MLRFKRDDYY
ncbi:hypothetical protein BN1723_009781 [Verticillium longisporum]|uniref:Uncharacterized protein n=1 Tax=Verticillium longisporum TaxID=100787 RepID=A0A0G4KSC0_VERLO|nr:hypothetical protein BN1723_009781 [Verticillium longisporum]